MKYSCYKKGIVFGIIVLFIGMSVVSSTGKIAEDYPFNNNLLESVNNPKDLLSCDHSAYIIGDGPNCYLYEFILNNASDLNCVCEGSSGDFSDATWSSDNYIYCVEYGSSLLIVIDIDSCEIWSIGGGGQSLNALAYDPLTQNMYGVGGTGTPGQDYLVKVDSGTGEQEEIGKLGGSIYYTVGISFDSEGTLYGWDIGTDSLFSIDTETGEATQVGPLGISLIYDCDGDFCKEDDILYIVHNNYLYIFDKDTGECELNNQFPDYVSVTGLAIPYDYDDTEPPTSDHELDPEDPDGLNGWYVNDVNVTIYAMDDISGVKEIRYTINGGPEQVIPGNTGTFIIHDDGDDILVEYWAIDNAGNTETKNSFTIDMDQTEPEILLEYEIIGGNPEEGWDLLFMATATDDMSGMNRVEFYLDKELQDIVYGPGPTYCWEYHYHPNPLWVIGLIRNLEITEEYIRFYAILVMILDLIYEPNICAYAYDNAGNWDYDEILQPCPQVTISPGFYLFRNLILPNNYTGYIGKYLISAIFNNS